MTTTTILNAIASVFPVTPADITGPRRRRNEAEARHLAVWLYRTALRMSNWQIGAAFNRLGCTAVYSRRAFERYYATDRHYRSKVDSVCQALGVAKPTITTATTN
jgi:chromosomal replication initiation ATPase DnaA